MARATTKAKPKAKAAAPTTPAVAPVTVARTGSVQDVPFKKGMTVSSAIEAAGYDFTTADEVRVNNKKTKNGEQKLKPGDTLLVLGNIRGA